MVAHAVQRLDDGKLAARCVSRIGVLSANAFLDISLNRVASI
jgi:hypothetical protein